jgi:hypothetical protein
MVNMMLLVPKVQKVVCYILVIGIKLHVGSKEKYKYNQDLHFDNKYPDDKLYNTIDFFSTTAIR